MSDLRIATRRSPLALWQAEHVAGALRERHSGLEVELVAMRTSGDKMLDAPLARVGGKGLFIKELEHALLDGRARRACAADASSPRIGRTCASRTCAGASTPGCGGSTTAISTRSCSRCPVSSAAGTVRV